jgi:uncharacterized protein (TIRG00374 family)
LITKQRIISFLQYLFFLLLGIGLFYYTFTKFDIKTEDLWDDISNLKYGWILLSLIVALFSHLSRAARWKMMLKPLGYDIHYQNSFFGVMVGYLFNTAIPRSGEVARCTFVRKYEKIPVSVLLGTVVMERVLDIILFLIFVLIAFILQGKVLANYFNNIYFQGNSNNSTTYTTLYILAALIIIGTPTFYYLYKRELLPDFLHEKLSNLAGGFKQGLISVFKVENPILFILHTVFNWFCFYLMNYLCLYAFEPTAKLGPTIGLMVFVFGTFGVMLPTPGGVGTYQAMVTNILHIYGVNGKSAFFLSNIIFISQTIFNILIGALSLMIAPIVNNKSLKK